MAPPLPPEPEVWCVDYVRAITPLVNQNKVHWIKIFSDGHMNRDYRIFCHPTAIAEKDAHFINRATEPRLLSESLSINWKSKIEEVPNILPASWVEDLISSAREEKARGG